MQSAQLSMHTRMRLLRNIEHVLILSLTLVFSPVFIYVQQEEQLVCFLCCFLYILDTPSFFHHVQKTSELGETAHLLGSCHAFNFMGNVSLIVLFPSFGFPRNENKVLSLFVCLLYVITQNSQFTFLGITSTIGFFYFSSFLPTRGCILDQTTKMQTHHNCFSIQDFSKLAFLSVSF